MWFNDKKILDKLRIRTRPDGVDFVDGDQCFRMNHSGVYYFLRHGTLIEYNASMDVIFWDSLDTHLPFKTVKHIYSILKEGTPVPTPDTLLAFLAQEQLNALQLLPE